MKQRAIAFIQSRRIKANGNKRRLLLVVLALLLTPPAARAAGIGDILTLIKTITSTIQGAIGGALSGIQTLHNMVNNFRQESFGRSTSSTKPGHSSRPPERNTED